MPDTIHGIPGLGDRPQLHPAWRDDVAFDPKQLSLLAYSNGQRLWAYKSKDRAKETLKLGYFAPHQLHAGDVLTVNANIGGPIEMYQAFVTGNSDGVVEVQAYTPIMTEATETEDAA